MNVLACQARQHVKEKVYGTIDKIDDLGMVGGPGGLGSFGGVAPFRRSHTYRVGIFIIFVLTLGYLSPNNACPPDYHKNVKLCLPFCEGEAE